MSDKPDESMNTLIPESMSIKIAVGTLGCRLNLFESDSLVSQFKEKGYQLCDIEDEADVYIINTCTVTNKSDGKSRNLIRKVKRQNPNSYVLVTGCYAETDREEVASIKEVDLVVGNKDKHRIPFILEKELFNETWGELRQKDNPFCYPIAKDHLHTRSFLKIQEGCNDGCTYCKIPLARGRALSRPLDDILETASQLISLGYREIVLTGVNMGAYRSNGIKFDRVVEELLALEGDYRISLSSIEPNQITEKLITLLKHPRLVKNLHLPLQSGSDSVLKAMNRKYDAGYYRDLVRNIRAETPLVNMTSDVIVGFPSESDHDFDETLKMVENCIFSHVHTFRYSPRRGTVADAMVDNVDGKVKIKRSNRLRQVVRHLKKRYAEQFINSTGKIIAETVSDNGETAGYDDYHQKILVPAITTPGQWLEFTYQSFNGNELKGILLTMS